MLSQAADAALRARREQACFVAGRRELIIAGFSGAAVDAQLRAGRWQRVGRAVVMHNGEIARDDALHAAVLNAGPRAALTGFTALEIAGLTGWSRPQIDVLVPAGARALPALPIPVRLHRTRQWDTVRLIGSPPRHRTPEATVVAASQSRTPRIATGLLAAVVQQRLARPEDLTTALRSALRLRHRHHLLLAMADIGMGSHALSEIDFAILCRRHNLPVPDRQAIRVEPGGRRRYLDASWLLSDGRHLAVEVDGSVHTTAKRWFDDQLRQNVIVLGGTLVLRYPSVVVRAEPELVAAQLRQILGDRHAPGGP